MSLLAAQRAFRAEIAASDDGPAPSSTGLEIYRSAYRGRLSGALETAFERTRRWVGAEAFAAAAAHYVLAQPPRSWSLDSYGADFPAQLAELFAGDPEVTELAWLEWQLQRAFAAPDCAELDPAALAAAGLVAGDWDRLGFAMAAGFATRAVRFDIAALWPQLAPDDAAAALPAAPAKLPEPAALLVWRKGLTPHYRIASRAEALALVRFAEGQSLGMVSAALAEELGAEAAGALLGQWLGGWLGEGLFADFALLPA